MAAEIVAEFEAKRQRRAPGYEPVDADDWREWIKERVLVPEQELPDHVAALADDEGLVWLTSTTDTRRWLGHRELLWVLTQTGLTTNVAVQAAVPRVDDPRDALQLALEMLSFYGPRTKVQIEALLPTVPEDLLEDGNGLISGALMNADDAEYFCDPDNYEMLLRFQRAAARPDFQPLSAEHLPGFLAHWQAFGGSATEANVVATLEQLRGYTAPVAAWLGELLSARLPAATDGQPRQRPGGARFLLARHRPHAPSPSGYPEDLDLLEPKPKAHATPSSELTALFSDPARPLRIQRASGTPHGADRRAK